MTTPHTSEGRGDDPTTPARRPDHDPSSPLDGHLVAVAAEPVPTGLQARVEWFCEDRGFGQLRFGDDLVYVCHRDILGEGFRSLQPGQVVAFTLGTDRHGTVARSVRPIATSRDTSIAS